jgi:hypothetical protein
MPIDSSLFPDLAFGQKIGLATDLWVPADDAANYAVPALCSGTISTARSLSPERMEQPFVPKDIHTRGRRAAVKRALPLSGHVRTSPDIEGQRGTIHSVEASKRAR